MACLRLNFIVPLLPADCNSHYGSRPEAQDTPKEYSYPWVSDHFLSQSEHAILLTR
jgi:hypothetical protein